MLHLRQLPIIFIRDAFSAADEQWIRQIRQQFGGAAAEAGLIEGS